MPYVLYTYSNTLNCNLKYILFFKAEKIVNKIRNEGTFY